MRVVRRPSFIADLDDAYAWVVEDSPRAASELLDSVDELVGMLKHAPEAGRVRDELGIGVRSFRVPRFRYVVYYRIDNQDVVLIRMLHGARDTAESDLPT